jgi:Golgi SNAP receptor complex protein 1
MATSWDNARRHARALEAALDTKLASYSRLAADIVGGGPGAGASSSRADMSDADGVGGYKLVEEEIEELLGKVSSSRCEGGWADTIQLEQAITDLTTLINSPSQPPSASMQHAAARHRDNYDDYKRDFVRVRNNIDAAVARSNLLGSVRKDIE